VYLKRCHTAESFSISTGLFLMLALSGYAVPNSTLAAPHIHTWRLAVHIIVHD
jgi:hypothetical protein